MAYEFSVDEVGDLYNKFRKVCIFFLSFSAVFERELCIVDICSLN